MLPSLMNAVPDFVWYVVLAVVALVFVAGVVLLGVAKVMRLSATRFLGRV